MERRVIVIFAILLCYLTIYSQTEAYKYKLHYSVPESPGFSVLGVNPNQVMKGSASQEVVLSSANNFLEGNNLDKGIAADFNPYFSLGGRTKGIAEYDKKLLLRILANTQLSFATIEDPLSQDNLLMGIGMRATIYDKKDLLQDTELRKKIDQKLLNLSRIPEPKAGVIDFVEGSIQTSQDTSLKDIYRLTKEKLRKTEGGSISIGWADAIRALGSSSDRDSFLLIRRQFWISGQYDFKKGINLMTLIMYRQNDGFFNKTEQKIDDLKNELKVGLGLRYNSGKVNFGGELIYNSVTEKIDRGINLEIEIGQSISFYVSYNRESELSSDNSKLKLRPGLRWNLSPKN